MGRATLTRKSGRRYTWSFNPYGGRLLMSPPGPVSSYLTFSPLSAECRKLFSSPLQCPHGHLPVRKYGALCCPDFPPFPLGKSDRTVCCHAKLRIYAILLKSHRRIHHSAIPAHKNFPPGREGSFAPNQREPNHKVVLFASHRSDPAWLSFLHSITVGPVYLMSI